MHYFTFKRLPSRYKHYSHPPSLYPLNSWSRKLNSSHVSYNGCILHPFSFHNDKSNFIKPYDFSVLKYISSRDFQVFYGGGTDNPALTLAGTYCGTSTIDYLEAPVQYRSVTVRLVVKAYTDTTTQIASTVTGNQAGSSAPAAVTSAAAGGASVSSSGGTSTAG